MVEVAPQWYGRVKHILKGKTPKTQKHTNQYSRTLVNWCTEQNPNTIKYIGTVSQLVLITTTFICGSGQTAASPITFG